MQSTAGIAPLVSSIVHPTDFSAGGEAAFAHALALALLGAASLTLLNVSKRNGRSGEWARFPGVRSTLESWGLLEPGSPRAAVFERLGVRVKKVTLDGARPAAVIEDYLNADPPDLAVLATEGRDGVPQWLKPSVAEQVARECRVPTLFVPKGARGFVAESDGHLTLRHILVPVDECPRPESALRFAARAAQVLGDDRVDITVLHVGEADAMPSLDLGSAPGVHWRQLQQSGPIIDGIAATAANEKADLLVMATRGRDGLLDVLSGSVTEQVLRRIPCPLLAIPSR